MNSIFAHLSLYQFDACPYCAKVRRALERLQISIDFRDTRNGPTASQNKADLLAGGGKTQVPCLRIESSTGMPPRWLYESDQIVSYLEKLAAPAP